LVPPAELIAPMPNDVISGFVMNVATCFSPLWPLLLLSSPLLLLLLLLLGSAAASLMPAPLCKPAANPPIP
jgi:hypothetical protein